MAITFRKKFVSIGGSRRKNATTFVRRSAKRHRVRSGLSRFKNVMEKTCEIAGLFASFTNNSKKICFNIFLIALCIELCIYCTRCFIVGNFSPTQSEWHKLALQLLSLAMLR